MSLVEAEKLALNCLKQVMEEKVAIFFLFFIYFFFLRKF